MAARSGGGMATSEGARRHRSPPPCLTKRSPFLFRDGSAVFGANNNSSLLSSSAIAGHEFCNSDDEPRESTSPLPLEIARGASMFSITDSDHHQSLS
ncbi:hypothetical protein PIB30_009458 [Stylosanthes scabra]|uniref:Uncharacterized protein n=1 Tax=Stylosanthes scabra TaxID=79078 RepID=A0ABU6X6Q2_9FABA|nr:hypothetical protein [Stylosanthes scabra]